MPLEDLPVELIRAIADCANFAALSALCRASRQLHIITESILYRKAVCVNNSLPVRWGASQGQWAPIEKWMSHGGDLLPLQKHESPLYLAVIHSQSDTVRRLLELGFDPNRPAPDGKSLLHKAAQFTNVGIARQLIAAGGTAPDEDAQDPISNLLALAARKANAEQMKFFLSRSTKIQPTALRCVGALAEAAAAGNMEAVKVLLDYGADLNPKRSTLFEAEGVPIMAAVNGNNVEIVQLLLEKGSSLDVRWTVRYRSLFDTPLHGAVAKSNPAMVTLLLDWGFDVNAMSDHRRTALDIAARVGDEASARILLDRGARFDIRDRSGNQPLVQAIAAGHTHIVEMFLAAGADPGPKSVIVGQQYPLEMAALDGNAEIVRMLLDRGADPDFTNYHGWTSLCRAVEKSHAQIVRYLLDHGADPNKLGGLDIPPLTHAARLGSLEIVSSLIEKGADVELADQYGFRPLHGAVRGGYKDVVELLLDHGADIECVGYGKLTPLFISASEGDEVVVRLLIERGANLDCREEAGLTPLAIANAEGHDDVATLLRNHGAHTTRELDGD